MKSIWKVAIVAMVVTNVTLTASAQDLYINNGNTQAQTANFWINGTGKLGNGIVLAKDGADVALTGFRFLNFAETRGANIQLTNGPLPGLATWIHDGTNWIERMRILPNGYVGIGTIAPTTKFAVWDTSTVAYTPTGTGSAIPPGSIGQIYNQSWSDGNSAHLVFTAINSAGNKNAAYIGVVSNSGSNSWTPDIVIGQRAVGNAWAERLRIASNGNMGIGLTNPTQKLDVNGVIQASGTPAGIRFNSRQQDGNDYQWYSAAGSARLYDHNNTTDRIVISHDGNVGIGTASPQAKLAVNGDIFSRRVKVTLTGWADFVFEPEYKLPALSELETYIKANKHLPEVPSAAEVTKDGLDVGEMNKILLQKIEELTLHLIEQDKRSSAQEDEIRLLKERIALISADTKRIEF